MALPPHVYRDAARNAEFQLQIRVERVTPPTVSLGNSIVEGTVVRVFRGDPTMLGQKISVRVATIREGDQPHPGGTIWTQWERLEKAAVLELCLNRHGDELEIACSQSAILDAVTDQPRIVYVDEPAQPEPTRVRSEPWLRFLLAGVMIFAGVNHFRAPEFYVRIMPAFLPREWDALLVAISGAFEILGGVGLLVPSARAWSARGLIALFIAVFPANVQAAIEPERMDMPSWAAWARLPFQLLFIFWALRYAKSEDRR